MPLEMPFKFISLSSTVSKQGVLFQDQRVLKIKYLSIEFLLLLFKEQQNKKTFFFFQALTTQRWKNPLRNRPGLCKMSPLNGLLPLNDTNFTAAWSVSTSPSSCYWAVDADIPNIHMLLMEK